MMQSAGAEISDDDVVEPLVAQAMDAAPLKILFAVDSRFPGVGGAEIQSIKLANALRDRGIEVDFVAPYLNKNSPIEETVDGFQLTKIDYPQVKLLGSLFLAIKFGHYLYKHQDEYDTVHIHITRILAASAGLVKPFISCTVITKISGFFEFQGGILDQKRRFNPANMLIRFALRKVDYVQTISEQTREKLELAGFRPDQIKFIPNGIEVDAEPADARDNRGRFVLGYCGRMREVKGVHILVEGFAALKKQNPDSDLLLRLAGDGETEQAIRKQAQALGLGDSVEFLGYIDDTSEFLSSLDLYVQPSFAEGLPNSVIEAMNAGLAVVATNIGGNNELVNHGETGRLFEAGDVAGLESQLQWCIDHRSELPGIGETGREMIASNYGFSQVTQELIALYREAR